MSGCTSVPLPNQGTILPAMPGNSFGQAFRVTTAGESHGPGNLVIVDGCPPGLPLGVEDLIPDLARRRPGQSAIVTPRDEPDAPEILSGVFEGRTTGASIAILVRNRDQRSRDYAAIRDKYRPGHADHGYDAKYGFRDYRGGGRSSARETTVRVAAGAIAKKLIAAVRGASSATYGVQYVAVNTGSSLSTRDNLRLTTELQPGTGNNLFVFSLP